MGGVVFQRYGERTTFTDRYKAFGAGFFQRGFSAQTSRAQCLHPWVGMLEQSLEALIGLGQRQRLFARGHADLQRWYHAQTLEHFSELIVTHQRLAHLRLGFFVTKYVLDGQLFVADGLQGLHQMVGLLCHGVGKVQLELLGVELQHGVDEHTQGQVDQLQLRLREASSHHLVEHRIGQVNVIPAILTVLAHLVGGKLVAAFALGIIHLGAFVPHAILDGHVLERHAAVYAMQSATHRLGIKPAHRFHVVEP